MRRVSIAIIEKDGRLLIGRREKHGPLRSLWEFPGGKIEPGETPEECVRREVFEEVGLFVKKVNFLCTSRFEYAHGAIELYAFIVHCESGEPGGDLYQTMKWVERGDLVNYEFPAANTPIIDRLVSRS